MGCHRIRELCVDPIFIDSSADGFPVYTAMHGQGTWEPKQIAVSLEAFGSALSVVAGISKGRQNPMALESNPLTLSEKEAALALIQHHNPGVKLEFWDLILS